MPDTPARRGRSSLASRLYCILLFLYINVSLYLMIGKILGFWLVNWHVIWSCINRSESCIHRLVFVCMYVCSFLLPVQRSRRQSWDKFVINCFGVWYNLYLAIRRLYHPRLRLGWYSHLIARYKLYHTPKQLITNSTYATKGHVAYCWPFSSHSYHTRGYNGIFPTTFLVYGSAIYPQWMTFNYGLGGRLGKVKRTFMLRGSRLTWGSTCPLGQVNLHILLVLGYKIFSIPALALCLKCEHALLRASNVLDLALLVIK